MTLKERKTGPSMEGSSAYRIRVRGHFHESSSRSLGGMKVVEYRGSGDHVETILQGQLADQAALAGVLNALYELHFPIISAEYLGENPSPMKDLANTAP